TETPSNATGTFSDTAQTVTYVYQKDAVAGQNVTVQFVDEAGNQLAEPMTLSGNIGDAFEAIAKIIDGWKLTATPANATGMFSDTTQTVTFVYKKAAITGKDVTVNYVDTEGNQLAPSEVLNGEFGTAYLSEAKVIDGWKLTATPANASGIFSDQLQTVNYVYEKVDSGTGDNTNDNNNNTNTDNNTNTSNETQVTPTQPSVVTIDSTESTSKAETAKQAIDTESALPTTGDSTNPLLILFGSLLAVGAFGMFFRRTRNNN
ncbi:MucBP domain-containing protein, partial [Listeria immobilis]|uniref:MucBP domain-containing protein n=1 Tax=Listeria immobilis TaxID=2713502 RepID=UPI0016289EDD